MLDQLATVTLTSNETVSQAYTDDHTCFYYARPEVMDSFCLQMITFGLQVDSRWYRSDLNISFCVLK